MEELLAIKLRPKKLSDIIGQKHLVGKDKVISNLVKNKKIFLSGYVDDENGVFYVTKIGHLPATGNSSDAK